MSMEALARAMGVSRQTIYSWERGETRRPQRETLALLASALKDVSAEYIETGYDPRAEGERISLEDYLRRYTILTEEEVAQVVRVTEWMETEHRIQAGELELVQRQGEKGSQFHAEGETRRATS